LEKKASCSLGLLGAASFISKLSGIFRGRAGSAIENNNGIAAIADNSNYTCGDLVCLCAERLVTDRLSELIY
jgi:hypothetical protein